MAEFKPVNLAEIYGQIDASRANQAQMENNRMLQERQRRQFAQEDEQLGEQRALKDVYRGAVTDVNGTPALDEKRLLSDLYRVAPEKALAQQEAFSKRDAEALKLKGETSKQALESKKATAAYLRDRLAQVQDQQGYEALLGEAKELGATALIQSAPPQFNPEWTRQQLFTADEFLKQTKPDYQKVDLGGKIQVIDMNPMTNPSIKGTQFDKTLTPEAMLTDQRTRSEGALSRGVTMRGQDLTDARAKEKNTIDASSGGYSTKPLPATSLKMQNEALDKLSIASNNNAKLLAVKKQIEDGKLNLGMFSNYEAKARNYAGLSNESSRNLSSFKSTLEKLRNDSLRLNTGVQTDGDAQRAWNELFENINDQELVKQRLGEIAEINKRGAELQKLQVESIRSNYNAAPVDFSKYEVAPPQEDIIPSGAAGVTIKKPTVSNW